MQILEEDDGSGWVKVADGQDGKGLVPASYIEAVESGFTARPAVPAGRAARAPAKSQQGSGKFGRLLLVLWQQ